MARNVFILEKSPNRTSLRKLSIVKGNYVSEAEKRKPLILTFDEDSLTYSRSDEQFVEIASPDCKKQKPGRKSDPVRDAKIMELHRAGVKQVDIAKEVGMDKSSISRIIKQNKILFDTDEIGPVP